ncbi:MAG: 4-hydroxybenzoate octaprenyltransferase, partial [Desulfovibrio sp.]|nr:4-hydroxybenzoate octaprenyltransferase [Desulfovibrio sp.]
MTGVQFGDICRMIKIEHSVFALPYAWAGAFLAAGGFPPWLALLLLTIAMIAVRSFAMTFNRIADLEYDAANPRTRDRPLITGAISLRHARLFCALMAAIFILACACLNSLCFWLSVPALLFAAAYSYLKRFSPYCHFWLGATLGLAPLAGWLAVAPGWPGLPVLMLFFAVTFWVGAFDIYYAFQDLEFDRRAGLHSLPADLGGEVALAVAAFSHTMTFVFLLLCGITAHLGWPWYIVCVGVGIMLLYEHRLVKPDDLRHV